MTADEFAAIEQARALMLRPAQVAVLRARDFPSGMRMLLRAAAGEPGALELAAERTGDTQSALREASVFYVQQVMLSDTSDSYRILGVGEDAPAAEIKAHYGLLMRWMHPDRNPDGWDAVFVDRVIRAWNDLRSSDRRSAFDAARLAPQEAHQEDWAGQAAPFRPASAQPGVPHRSESRHSRDANRKQVPLSPRSIAPKHAAAAGLAAACTLAMIVVWPGFDGDSAPARAPAVRLGDEPTLAPLPSAASAGSAAVPRTTLPSPPLVAALVADGASAGATSSKAGTVVVARTLKPVQAVDLPVAAQPPKDVAAPAQVLAAATGSATELPRTGRQDASRQRSEPADLVASGTAADAAADDRGPAQPAAAARDEAAAAPLERESAHLPVAAASLASAVSVPTGSESPVVQAAAPDLDQASLLIGRFARAYQRGDIDAMSALFAQDAQSQGGGITEIREAYDRLFEQTSHRSISIRDIQWRIEDERARAVGHFEISQARDKNSKTRVSRGTIRFDIEQRQDQLLIARLEHTDRGL